MSARALVVCDACVRADTDGCGAKDVINTLGRGISVQEWAPCFSGEVIGKKPG